ncbi:hypothetical protein SLEP1_g54584 [Rubroshorea leprosula]|uniref:Uncharacterized protein n=1 Tax=Rubroshorea leprosula TaxID=152421 RepID=A0AAV5MDV7_9ROSI|nr:hypothetical protein SLEP1_g54584 [Rubroshorea leprosula]
MQNKVSMDIAVNRSSLDSLSFADFVCMQDQLAKSPPATGLYKISEEDLEFEFRPAPQNLGKFLPADVFSNSEKPPQAVLTQAIGKPRYKNSLPASHISSNRSKGNQNDYIKASAKAHKVRNQANKDGTAQRSWFGQKLLLSFVAPHAGSAMS